MTCIGDIKCSTCRTVFRGTIGRDKQCPSCLCSTDEARSQSIELIERLKSVLTTCSCGCDSSESNTVFYNGYGFANLDHFYDWYKKLTGSDAFPNMPFVTHENNHLFLVGARPVSVTIEDLINQPPYT